MVALTGVEPADGQRWLVHLGLSGVFSVQLVRGTRQNTRHRRLWCWTRAGRVLDGRPFFGAPRPSGKRPNDGAQVAPGAPSKPPTTLLAVGSPALALSRTWAPRARRRRQVAVRRQVAAGGARVASRPSAWRVGSVGLRTPEGSDGYPPLPVSPGARWLISQKTTSDPFGSTSTGRALYVEVNSPGPLDRQSPARDRKSTR